VETLSLAARTRSKWSAWILFPTGNYL